MISHSVKDESRKRKINTEKTEAEQREEEEDNRR